MRAARSDGEHGLGLAALLSSLLVAFTIEFDNEFEHRMPHRTTRHGRTAGPGPRPWLISMAMWVQVMRLVPEGGIRARDLVRRSQLTPRSTEAMVKRVGQWWGYLELGPDPTDRRAKPPVSEWLVRTTKAGRMAQEIWAPLTDEIEARWDDRFGQAAVDELRTALTDVVGRLDLELPDSLLGEPRLPAPQLTGADRLPLPGLLSKVLLSLALDFDDHSDLSLDVYTSGVASRLPICANVLRLIGDDGVAVVELPKLSGVDKMAIDNWVGILDRRGYIEVATDPGVRRRVARSTTKGARARDAYFRWTESVEGRWPDAQSSAAVRRLRRAAERIVGNPGPSSPLWKGIEPYPDGWRSQIPTREVLPHFPAVTAKGGFPDGS